jgi:hypothetical protein
MTRPKTIRADYNVLIAISIGDPAIAGGDGSAIFLYGGIITGIAASIILWFYFNRKNKLQR